MLAAALLLGEAGCVRRQLPRPKSGEPFRAPSRHAPPRPDRALPPAFRHSRARPARPVAIALPPLTALGLGSPGILRGRENIPATSAVMGGQILPGYYFPFRVWSPPNT